MPPEDLDDRNVGNRFDSPTGDYGVGYFGTDAEACYAETLARFRPDASLEHLFDHEDSMGFGHLPRAWREGRRLVNVGFEPTLTRPRLEFVDIEEAQTIRHLEKELAGVLALYGYSKLNVSVLRGSDRRVTRLVSKYVHSRRDERGQHLYAGIRYLSQLGSNWECWAMFEGVELKRLSTTGIALEDDTFQRVTKLYDLTAF